jgi:hypothetical protein
MVRSLNGMSSLLLVHYTVFKTGIKNLRYLLPEGHIVKMLIREKIDILNLYAYDTTKIYSA